PAGARGSAGRRPQPGAQQALALRRPEQVATADRPRRPAGGEAPARQAPPAAELLVPPELLKAVSAPLRRNSGSLTLWPVRLESLTYAESPGRGAGFTPSCARPSRHQPTPDPPTRCSWGRCCCSITWAARSNSILQLRGSIIPLGSFQGE